MRLQQITTRAQREALKRVFDRDPLYLGPANLRQNERVRGVHAPGFVGPISYRTFRKLAHCGRDYMIVPWCGMWLGIEPDGHTHS